jgi:hypothetical protein
MTLTTAIRTAMDLSMTELPPIRPTSRGESAQTTSAFPAEWWLAYREGRASHVAECDLDLAGHPVRAADS